MAESQPGLGQSVQSPDENILHQEEKTATPGPVEIGSPLTPVDHVQICTPHEPSSRRVLFHQNDDADDSNDAIDEICYDSDGNLPPAATLNDTFHAELEIWREDDDVNHDCSEEPVIVILSEKEIKKLKVDQLRKELRMRGLPHFGKKAELLERMKKAMDEKIPIINETTTSAAPNGFDKTAKWRLLEPSEEVMEPENIDSTLVDPGRARDQRARGVSETCIEAAKKFNYAQNFRRNKFVGTALQLSNGKISEDNNQTTKKRKRKQKPSNAKSRIYEKLPIKNLIPNIKFTEKHHLDEFSHPAAWFRSFIPEIPKKGESNSSCIQKWCQYTNMKAELDFSGQKHSSGLSYKFVPFTPREIEQHLAMYMIQGLNPSPQLKLKAKSQSIEPFQGNDLVYQAIGDNFEKRHKQFKRYFAVQHPYVPVPDSNSHPNWKIDPFLKILNQVFIQAVHLPENISCDEQTIAFHGRSKHKVRIKFKKTGDGFQADTLCSEGYTFTFYFRHQNAPKKYLDEGYSPLHARVRFMFDQLKAENHSVFMDNLYMSASFARSVISCDKKVKIHGVTRREGKGIPQVVKQYEVQDKKELEKVRNNVKVAVLEGDSAIEDLIAISYYDSKPVYFLSTVIPDISWHTCGKQVYSKNLNQQVTKYFLRPNFVNVYNFDMNSVDRADHLRKNYCLGEGLRQRKWWFSIFLWGLDVAMVNAYLLYKSWMNMHGFPPMSHYRFREAVALAWMDSETYWPDRYRQRRRNKVVSPSNESLNTRKSNASVSSLSRQTRSTTASQQQKQQKKHCSTLTQGSIDSGKFGSRLIHTGDCTHMPTPVHSKHSECQLHKWANKRTRKQVMICPDCNLTLCVSCYKPFHTVYNLNSIKADIENDREINISKVPLCLEAINVKSFNYRSV